MRSHDSVDEGEYDLELQSTQPLPLPFQVLVLLHMGVDMEGGVKCETALWPVRFKSLL